MFAHQYINDFYVALGYGNGLVQIIDIRMNGVVGCLKDKNLSMVGDICVQRSDGGNVKLGVSGVGGYSVWEISSGMNESTHLDSLHINRSSITHSNTGFSNVGNSFNPSKAHHIPLLTEEYVSFCFYHSMISSNAHIVVYNPIARI